jgi:ADP-ribose pyrophosphatase YjhB (NUDIX family)
MSGQNEHKNPIPTVDTIIDCNSQVLFIKRAKEPFKDKMVLPGGFMNIGETVEEAAKREVKEETSLDIDLVDILGVYSDPARDPRGHIMSTVFIGKISPNSNTKEPKAGDGATLTKWVNVKTIEQEDFGFDHKQILGDYEEWKKSRQTFWSSRRNSKTNKQKI